MDTMQVKMPDVPLLCSCT